MAPHHRNAEVATEQVSTLTLRSKNAIANHRKSGMVYVLKVFDPYIFYLDRVFFFFFLNKVMANFYYLPDLGLSFIKSTY